MASITRCLVLLLLLVGLLALACGADEQPELKQQPSEGSSSPESSPVSAPASGDAAKNAGLFSQLLSPLRKGFRRAKQLLGAPGTTIKDSVDNVRLQAFKVFMRVYNKTYTAEEMPKRMALFVQRRQAIEQSVRMFEQGKSLFAMRENVYTDWDDDELKKLTGVSPPSPQEMEAELESEEQEASDQADSSTAAPASSRAKRSIEGDTGDDDGDDPNITVRAEIPASKDWRQTGCIAKPMNQLKCGACYAIATMGVLESQRCLNKVSSPTLSAQQVVDCSRAYQNYGCDGGWPTRVLKYLQDVRVVTRETCYPFVWRQNSCKLRQVQAQSGCSLSASPTDTRLNYKVLRNERDILREVGTRGPVITVMKASDKFLYYGSGIFDDPSCSGKRDDVDHAISIVGYGRENGVDYWIIKNSWGTTSWGQGGYGKYRRGVNSCSIGHWGWVITS